MRRSVYNETDARASLAVANRTNGTVNGTAVDTLGYRTAMVVAIAGGITDGTHTISLQDSDDGSTNWLAVSTDDAQASGPAWVAADANKVAEFGLAQIRRRFLRVVVVTTGATTGGSTGAVIVLAGGRRRPVTHLP